LTLKSNIF